MRSSQKNQIYGIGTAVVGLAFLLSGCNAIGAGSKSEQVQVQMQDRTGKNIGTLQLQEVPTGVKVTGHLTGLQPGEHGFHIHQNPVCEAPSFESAGGHFNPTQKKHGSMNDGGQHVGDLGNIQAAAGGDADINAMATQATLSDGDRALLANGASIVVHANPDDLRTDPSGNSGDRIACGVIHEHAASTTR